MKSLRPFSALVSVVFLTFFTSGCTLMQEVRPWQKEALAHPDMALNPDLLQSAHHEHVYFSREAGMGGHSVGAGGCGCN